MQYLIHHVDDDKIGYFIMYYKYHIFNLIIIIWITLHSTW